MTKKIKKILGWILLTPFILILTMAGIAIFYKFAVGIFSVDIEVIIILMVLGLIVVSTAFGILLLSEDL